MSKPENSVQILPWQEAQWQQLITSARANRLGHAWLLSGMAGLGKLRFAQTFAQTLLCATGLAQGRPCGTCKPCHWMNTAAHPNFKLLQADDKLIKIEQIRNLCNALTQTCPDGQYNITIIAPAEAMHPSAANALLKTLEEPVANSLLLLISHCPAQVPITIRSRCQQLQFKPAYQPAALNWLNQQLTEQQDAAMLLRLANGSPFAALQLGQDPKQLQQHSQLLQQLAAINLRQADPIQVAAQYLSLDLDRLLSYLLGFCIDLLRLSVGVTQAYLTNQHSHAQLQGMLKQINLFKLLHYSDKLCQLRKQVQGNLNQQLLLEDLFCDWYNLAHE